MKKIPEIVSKEWKNREDAVVFSTVDGDGRPNSIYASCTSMYDESRVVVADNFFNKTKANIQSGSKGSILFITKEGKSYQLKGSIEYFTEGPIFDDMKKWNPEKLPGNAAAVLCVEEAYCGGEKLL